jgi:hypothetical protein
MPISSREGEVPLEMRSVMRGSNGMPNYAQLYPKVFSEEAFDMLPPRYPWDHTIDLTLSAEPLWGKCYPLSRNEKEELDHFLIINLKAGKIQPSTLRIMKDSGLPSTEQDHSKRPLPAIINK